MFSQNHIQSKVKRTITGLITVFLMILSGCASHQPPVQPPPKMPLELPTSFSTSGITTSPDEWWLNFNDDKLTQLIEKALSDNLSIKSSWAKIDKATALRSKSRVSRRVTANGSLSGNFNDTRTLRLVKTYSLSVPASYEVDLYNRLQNNIDAATSDLLATKYGLETTAQSLAATVGETWFNLLRTNRELDLSSKQIELNTTYLELMEIRFAQGQANALDVYQQRQQLANTRLIVPNIKAEKALLKNQLAILIGRAPGTISLPEPMELPTLPELPQTGLPIELLDERPDVKAAFAKLMAANSRLAAAITQRKPSLKLTAEPGFGSATPASLLSSFLWRLGASLMAPVIDGGRIKADIFQNKAEVEDALNQYGLTIINAIGEVEAALIKEKHQKERIERIEENLEITQDTLREAKLRYMNGLSDYLPSIAALTTLQSLERELVLARQQLLSHRISLYRALGGHWSETIERN